MMSVNARETDLEELLGYTRRRSLEYFESLPERNVMPALSSDGIRQLVGSRLSEAAESAGSVIRALADAGLGGTVASTGPR